MKGFSSQRELELKGFREFSPAFQCSLRGHRERESMCNGLLEEAIEHAKWRKSDYNRHVPSGSHPPPPSHLHFHCRRSRPSVRRLPQTMMKMRPNCDRLIDEHG